MKCVHLIVLGCLVLMDNIHSNGEDAEGGASKKESKDSPAVYYPCMRRCMKKEVKAYRNGNMTCSDETPEGPGPTSQCHAKCSDNKKDPPASADQTQCYCNHCKRVNGTGYCEKFGKPIEKNECESLACTGKAKYHGDFCKKKKPSKKDKSLTSGKIPIDKAGGIVDPSKTAGANLK